MTTVPQMSGRSYFLLATLNQVRVLADACLLYAQVLAGNIECMTQELLNHGGDDVRRRREVIEKAHQLLCDYKPLVINVISGNKAPLGDVRVPESAVQAYAVYLALSPENGRYDPFPALAVKDEAPRLYDRDVDRLQFVFSEMQGWAMVNALDLFSRIHLGQLDSVYWTLLVHEMSRERIEELQYLKALIATEVNRLVTGKQSNASWGITSPEISDRARVAFDLQQVIRHRLAWDTEPEGDITVSFDKPMRTSFEESLAYIERLNSH